MISKKKTRDVLKAYLYKHRDEKNGSRNWVITGFRHAIFNTVDLCKAIIGCRYEMNLEDKTTTCYLFFKTCTAKCVYKVFEDKVIVEHIETVEKDNELVDVVTGTYECSCAELPEIIKKIQPKVKLVIKKRG